MKKKEKDKGKWLFLGLCIGMGIVMGLLAGNVEAQNNTGTQNFGLSLISLGMKLFIVAVLLYIHIIIHEAGHLIAGKLTGYKFVSFRIGGIMLIRKEGKLVWKRYQLAGTGGQCLMEPPELVDGNFPCVAYNLGGCLANMIVAMISLGIWYLTKTSSSFAVYFLEMAVIGVISALINGIPMHVGGIDNDGYNVIHLGKHSEAKRCFWLQFKINALLSREVRLKEMPKDWFEMPKESCLDNALCAAMGVNTYCLALDEMDIARAKELGQYILDHGEGLIGLYKSLMQAEMLFCELVTNQQVDRINDFYNRGTKKFLKAFATHPQGLRIQYAIDLLFNKDTQKANRTKEAFEKLARYYPNSCELEGERDLMTYVRQCYDNN